MRRFLSIPLKHHGLWTLFNAKSCLITVCKYMKYFGKDNKVFRKEMEKVDLMLETKTSDDQMSMVI